MKFIDVHSHLNLSDFNEDREDVIAKLQTREIASIVVGVDKETSETAVSIAETAQNLYACVGQHPTDNRDEKFDIEFYRNLALREKVVAIGECGLDYFRIKADDLVEKNRQREIFLKHIELALDVDLPLMLHCRPQKGTMDAYEDALGILESIAKEKPLRGNVHFFVGDKKIADRFLKIGFTLSFTGVITFAKDYDDVVRHVPLDMILSETDSPFVAPVPYRGKRSEPAYVEEVVKKVAELRNEDFETVRRAIVATAERIFGVL